jgi:Glycosyl transferases group 1
LKIIIGAVMSRSPLVAGSVWNRIHRLLGFRRLGHDVCFVEELTPERCIDARGQLTDFEHCVNREVFRGTLGRYDLLENACLLYNRGDSTFGLSRQSLATVCREADLLINMSGHIVSEVVLGNVKRRVFIDEDPVYTQLWHAEYAVDQNLARHHVFFTVGLNVGTPVSTIPDCGVKWHPLLPPVTVDLWPVDFNAAARRFTTIASWVDFEDLHYRGEWYRSKAEEFQRFASLARRTPQELEVALSSDGNRQDEIRSLQSSGWIVADTTRVTSLSGYQQYIASSRAEIGIAKHAYVKARCGWFSDRSSHYLASGKPVLAQSTGVEGWLPSGRGFLTFEDMEQAVQGIEVINKDYARHCRAAREFAEEYLDYRKILPKMLELSVA